MSEKISKDSRWDKGSRSMLCQCQAWRQRVPFTKISVLDGLSSSDSKYTDFNTANSSATPSSALAAATFLCWFPPSSASTTKTISLMVSLALWREQLVTKVNPFGEPIDTFYNPAIPTRLNITATKDVINIAVDTEHDKCQDPAPVEYYYF